MLPLFRRKVGFSLVELLVCVVLVAVLVGVMTAAISHAGVSMKNTQCVNKLRKLAVGCFAYAGDHQQRLPFRYVEGARWTGYGDPLWYVAIAPYFGVKVTNEIAGEIQPAEAFICPADKVPWVGNPGFKPSCSYAYPISLVSRNADGSVNDTGASVNLATRFYQASATVMLIDSAFGNIFNIHNYRTASGSLNDPAETGQVLIRRHRGHLNAVFADGHCEPISGNTPSFDPQRPHLWGNQAF